MATASWAHTPSRNLARPKRSLYHTRYADGLPGKKTGPTMLLARSFCLAYLPRRAGGHPAIYGSLRYNSGLQAVEQFVDVVDLMLEPDVEVLDFDGMPGLNRQSVSLKTRHRQCQVKSLGGIPDIGGCDGQRELAQLLECACRARKHQHTATFVDYRPLFSNQVHPVHNGIYQQRIIELHGSQRLHAIIFVESLDRRPSVSAVALVDLLDQLLDFTGVAFVFRQCLARWHQKCQEAHFAEPFRMLFEHQRVSLKAAQDILGWLDAVHPHNSLLSEQGKNFIGGASPGQALYQPFFLCHRDRDRVGMHLRAVSLPPDRAFREVHNRPIQQGTRAL